MDCSLATCEWEGEYYKFFNQLNSLKGRLNWNSLHNNNTKRCQRPSRTRLGPGSNAALRTPFRFISDGKCVNLKLVFSLIREESELLKKLR